MTDAILDMLSRRVAMTPSRLNKLVGNMTETEMNQAPSKAAPPIGWHIFHIARWSDIFQSSFLNREELWFADSLRDKYRLSDIPLGLLEMGTLMTDEDATRLPEVMGRENLMAYSQAVFELANHALDDLTIDDLYAMRESILRIDFSADPMTEAPGKQVPTINDIMFHIGHVHRHLGMIEGLIGATLDRSGTATV